jgi:uncharacterized phage-like protein YoqJ
MIEKTVCFTGHRYLKRQYQNWAFKTLEQAIKRASDNEYTWFMSGGAPYWDWWFLDYAIKERTYNAKHLGELGFPDNIVVGAALPFPSFWEYYKNKRQDDEMYIKNHLEAELDIIVCVEQGNYAAWKMHQRNRWLVDNCTVMMSVYDGRKRGGTYQTLKYAKEKGKPILWIDPVNREEKWVNVSE